MAFSEDASANGLQTKEGVDGCGGALGRNARLMTEEAKTIYKNSNISCTINVWKCISKHEAAFTHRKLLVPLSDPVLPWPTPAKKLGACLRVSRERQPKVNEQSSSSPIQRMQRAKSQNVLLDWNVSVSKFKQLEFSIKYHPIHTFVLKNLPFSGIWLGTEHHVLGVAPCSAQFATHPRWAIRGAHQLEGSRHAGLRSKDHHGLDSSLRWHC